MFKLDKNIDNLFPMAHVVRNFKYFLVFKTTHYCWYKCAHCCENAGPAQPKTYIPEDVIKSYLTQAQADPQFSNSVVLTGGEIFSAYRFGPQGYVPNLLNFCLDNKIGTDIKTNAAWAHTTFGKRIFDDLTDIISSHDPLSLQFSLSLDKFHTASTENNRRVISTLARKIKRPCGVHISRLGETPEMRDEMIKKLRNSGLSVDRLLVANGDTLQERFLVNNKIIMKESVTPIRAAGRGCDLAEATPDEFIQFKILTEDMRLVMAFDSFGYVTLGENGARKIRVPWRDKNGAPRPLAQIRADLVRATKMEEIRARIFEGWRFHTKTSR